VWGARTMREAIIASTVRARDRAGGDQRGEPRRCIAVQRLHMAVRARARDLKGLCQRPTKVSPCSERRMISISGSGQVERLPSVSFLTVPPSR